MPVYEYRGVERSGKEVKGVLDSDNPRTLKDELRGRGIFLSSYKETYEAATDEGGGAANKKRWFARRVKVIELAEATRLISTLLKASISLVDALAAVGKQTENPRLQRVLNEVRRSVTEGKALHLAMKDHPTVFPNLYINMVKAGESSGTLDKVFMRLADFTEAQTRLRSRIIGAMTYPVIMLVIGTGIVSLLMVFVVPKLTVMFSEMGGKLPAITRGLIWVSEYVQDWWHVSLVGLVVLTLLFNQYRKSDSGRKRIDRISLKLPLFGPLLRLVAITRFARTLGTLLESGVPIITSLEIVKHVIGNTLLSDVVEECRLAVQEGDSLAPPLQRSGQFPPMLVHMISVGEQSGEVEDMLDNVATAYEAQVDARINILTSLLEPLMIVGLGFVVALIVFAILTPMLQMNELLKG